MKYKLKYFKLYCSQCPCDYCLKIGHIMIVICNKSMRRRLTDNIPYSDIYYYNFYDTIHMNIKNSIKFNIFLYKILYQIRFEFFISLFYKLLSKLKIVKRGRRNISCYYENCKITFKLNELKDYNMLFKIILELKKILEYEEKISNDYDFAIHIKI